MKQVLAFPMIPVAQGVGWVRLGLVFLVLLAQLAAAGREHGNVTEWLLFLLLHAAVPWCARRPWRVAQTLTAHSRPLDNGPSARESGGAASSDLAKPSVTSQTWAVTIRLARHPGVEPIEI